MATSEWQEVSYRKRRSVFERLGPDANNTLSVYVSNFPTHFSVRELSIICGKKGSIVDAYIAKNKNKFGQMFGFCRYSGVDNQESLIESLNRIWIGKLRLHANVARFAKHSRNGGLKPSHDAAKHQVPKVKPVIVNRDVEKSHSFSNVVKGVHSDEKAVSGDPSGDELNFQDDSTEMELAILGCHKDFRTIANSKIICRNEGFTGVDVKYLGGLWVLFTFQDKLARDSFLKHDGIISWFSSLKLWHNDFVLPERLVWLEFEGVPIRAWNDDTFKGICRKWGEAVFIDNSDSSNRYTIRVCIKSTNQFLIFESTTVTLNKVSYTFRVRELCSWTPTFVPETNYSEDEGFKNTTSVDIDEEVGEGEEFVGDFNNNEDKEDPSISVEDVDQPINSDPFDLTPLIAKKDLHQSVLANNMDSDTATPDFPPGFTQLDNGGDKHEFSDVNKPNTSSHGKIDEVPKKYFGVSMIQQVEDTIKVGMALGFNMDGCQDMLQKMIGDMGDKFVVK